MNSFVSRARRLARAPGACAALLAGGSLPPSLHAATPDDAIDALIDLCVVAIGTLDVFNVDAKHAWNEVLNANMNKQVGVKESRPNPLGLPDLIKPEGWKAPDHTDQMTDLDFIFLEKWIDKK